MEVSGLSILWWVVLFVVGMAVGGGLIEGIRRGRVSVVHRLLERHFAPTGVSALSVTEREFPARVRVDLQQALERFIEGRTNVERLCGVRTNESMERFFGLNLSQLLVENADATSVPVEHEEVDVGEDQPIRCAKNALWLLTFEKSHLAILLSQVAVFNQPPKVRLDVAGPNNPQGAAFCRDLFKELEGAVQEAKSYRGKILSLEPSEAYTGESIGINVHKLPPVAREEVILPGATLELLERNVIQFVGQRAALKKLGQSGKKGLLFHGPPGNGKTHTIRYLIGHLEEHTTLLITGEQVGQLAEYMALARLLQPTLVVLEDVDLIARERSQAGSPCQESLLNKLLNEMDGLKEDSEVMFVLTTNRPEAIEAALACRPGRVDQAIEFPLPDEAGREKLVRLYAGTVDVPEQLVQLIVQRTPGVSAAFIKELMRRTLQFHLVRCHAPGIEAEDIDDALQELLIGGGRLNRTVLGVDQGEPKVGGCSPG